jgi:hypothetical protein
MKKMEKNEKMLLLDLLLQDIRGNWGWENNSRTDLALQLANELGLGEHINRINSYLRLDYRDGRHFRIAFENGGYEGMKNHHDLEYTFNDKSEEFRKLALEYLTYPEYRFADIES